ncbi:UDP-glucose 4-epimerase GalE [Croceimicrobium hydrocarbonivorans]|uniref:UDP-glucose 4-epimerase n=1 Tax=Croceimicrobium hydrocarbonivorans TaxID=2761580 RepID=A0A7H0VBK4_9FLAO|nr:UDP-glucose 4-epimerase GalE [Croceimicrobium hydrocarbonivorans]QNR23102.1 UDP-glucose 4-epimerase GalE [Croceimicrobium hydrocarbonivorans]
MAQILVTGGLGFIGSHTAVELIKAGHEPVLIDDLSNSTASVLDGIEEITGHRPVFERVDLKSKAEVRDFFGRYSSLDGIIHFAAFKAVGESVHKPLEYYENNLGSLVYLLQEMRDLQIDNLIFSSSCTVYGEADELPITENSPVKAAISPYGNTKQVGEEIIQDAIKAHGFNAISLRYFNPIGAHPSAMIGESPLGVPLNLVPYVTQTAAKVREQLAVFGSDYETRDGTNERDYIHVVDVAKAHVVALNRLLNRQNEGAYEVFNLGTGTGSTVLEVIQSFERVSNSKLNYKIVERRPGDVTAAYADTTKANTVLGWTAEKSLDDAMADAWRWEKKIRNID